VGHHAGKGLHLHHIHGGRGGKQRAGFFPRAGRRFCLSFVHAPGRKFISPDKNGVNFLGAFIGIYFFQIALPGIPGI